jgi:hypothetical protein
LRAVGVLRANLPHGLLGMQFSGSAANSAQKNQVCKQWEFLGQSPTQVSGSSFLWCCFQGSQSYSLLPSTEAEGPTFTGALLSSEVQSEGSRSCIRGDCGGLSSFVCEEVRLTFKGVPSYGAWSDVPTSVVGDQKC